MSLISRNTIDRVHATARIEVIVEKFGPKLKKAGVNLTACCPFHKEKTESFVVSPAKGIYKCFGCGEGGGPVSFVMKVKPATYPEAIELIAEVLNIPLEYEEETPQRKEFLEKRERLFQANELAAQKYAAGMFALPDDHAVIQYLAKRDIDRETIIEWQLGYAPEVWQNITDLLQHKNLHNEGVELGLIKKKDERHYDLFINRIIFPICSQQGRILSFGGRVLDDSKPKYLNSPQSELYNKSAVLYGLHKAINSIRKTKRAYLVEGYLDVISMHKAGLDTTVSSCGTAVTFDQLKGLKSHCDELIFIMDGDKAGINAMAKSLPEALVAGFKVRVVPMREKINWEQNTEFFKELSAHITIEFFNAEPGKKITVAVIQGEGAYRIEWPEVNWKDGKKPAIASEKGKVTLFTFENKEGKIYGEASLVVDGKVDTEKATAVSGIDPDEFCRYNKENAAQLLKDRETDALTWYANNIFSIANTNNPDDLNDCTTKVSDLLSLIENKVRRQFMCRALATELKKFGVKEADLRNATDTRINERVVELADGNEDTKLPEWVDHAKYWSDGFVQKEEASKQHKIGIYFESDKTLKRYTNFTVRPLFQIVDMNNGRRNIEIWNGRKRAVVELDNRCFVEKGGFETALMNKGPYYTEPGFNSYHFKKIVAWLVDNMPAVYELSTLGWQPEGFFAFSNVIYSEDGAVKYDEYGVAEVGDHHYLSPGINRALDGEREENNMYESDLYLKHVDTKISFEQWATLFYKVYGKHAEFGIAFLFITLFKDLVTKTTKCPHLYCYGPKGSGKSAFAESLMWFFFSGKNAEGKLVQGFNLNPGQATPFSFFNTLERFRNIPRVYNEYDPNTIEFWKKGAFKSAYDGEGREVGSGETGKKRRTKIQKVQGTCILVGQYLDTTDDGSVLSRSIPRSFSLEENKNRTDADKENWKLLNEYEHKGLSGLLAELMKYRPNFKEQLPIKFWEIQSGLTKDIKRNKKSIEMRLLSNYSLCLTMIYVARDLVKLPFSYDDFYRSCYDEICSQADQLKETSALQTFWKYMEVMLDKRQISPGYDFEVIQAEYVELKESGTVHKKSFDSKKKLVMLRFSNVYAEYAKKYREQTTKKAPDEETLIIYLKDHPCYVGLSPQHRFKDKKTSCYVIDYEQLEVNLERDFEAEPPTGENPSPTNKDLEKTTQGDLPF